jgi:hypothetical protein
MLRFQIRRLPASRLAGDAGSADRRGWLGLTGLPVTGADPGYLYVAKGVAA